MIIKKKIYFFKINLLEEMKKTGAPQFFQQSPPATHLCCQLWLIGRVTQTGWLQP